jgi:hypothetical protein
MIAETTLALVVSGTDRRPNSQSSAFSPLFSFYAISSGVNQSANSDTPMSIGDLFSQIKLRTH